MTEWITLVFGMICAFVGGISLAPTIRNNYLRIMFAIGCFVASGMLVGVALLK
jgi:hypothetical protein